MTSVVTPAVLRRDHVRSIVGGKVEFLELTTRQYTMQRCIVAPEKHDQLLEVAAELVRASRKRPREQQGTVIIFARHERPSRF